MRTQEELLTILASGHLREDTTLEFKKELDIKNNKEHAAKLSKAVIALANTQGGELIVGVSDDGVLVGVSEENLRFWRNEDNVLGKIDKHVEPRIEATVRVLEHDEMCFPVVSVEPSHEVVFVRREYGDILQMRHIYHRCPGAKAESVAIQSTSDMRRLVQRQVTHELRRELQKIQRLGLLEQHSHDSMTWSAPLIEAFEARNSDANVAGLEPWDSLRNDLEPRAWFELRAVPRHGGQEV